MGIFKSKKQKLANSILEKINTFEAAYSEFLDFNSAVRAKMGNARGFFSCLGRVKTYFEKIANGRIKNASLEILRGLLGDFAHYCEEFSKKLERSQPSSYTGARTKEEIAEMDKQFARKLSAVLSAFNSMKSNIINSEDVLLE